MKVLLVCLCDKCFSICRKYKITICAKYKINIAQCLQGIYNLKTIYISLVTQTLTGIGRIILA